jgi:aminopeptidase N
MRAQWLLAVSLLWPPTAPGASVLDGYPRRIGIDIERYRFELTLADDTDVIVGRATISVRFTSNGVGELALDLTGADGQGRGMRVRAVSSTGQALAFEHAEDQLTITLPEPGRVGARRDVVVDYDGIPTTGLRIGPNKHGERTFFSDNWPDRARAWLPTVDHPYDKAMCDFVVTAPAH